MVETSSDDNLLYWLIGSYHQRDTKCPGATEPSYRMGRSEIYLWFTGGDWIFGTSVCTTSVSVYYRVSENGGNKKFWEVENGNYHVYDGSEWVDTTVKHRTVGNGTCLTPGVQ